MRSIHVTLTNKPHFLLQIDSWRSNVTSHGVKVKYIDKDALASPSTYVSQALNVNNLKPTVSQKSEV